MRTFRTTGLLTLLGGCLLAGGCSGPVADPSDTDDATGAYVPAWRTSTEQTPKGDVGKIEQALTTPPPAPVLTKPEWSTLQGVMLRWPVGWPELKPVYLSMLPPLQSQLKVYIAVANRKARSEATADIQKCAACSLSNIEWVEAKTNTIWMRDYGPEFDYASSASTLSIIDLTYSPTRPSDEAFPQTFAKTYGLKYYTPGLRLSGGNFQVDGGGNCFTSKYTAEINGEATARSVFQQYFGCTQTHFIDYIAEEGTHHIDMWMKFLSPTKVLVGDYTYQGNEVLSYPDTVNEPKLDAIATELAGLGYEVIRIPQPTSYMSSLGSYTIRTYTNSNFANQRILVPVYGLPTDAQALSIYDSALPSSMGEVGINSSYIIDYGGAMHCISMEKHP